MRPRRAAAPAARIAGRPAQGGRARRAAGAGAVPARLAGRGRLAARRRRRGPAARGAGAAAGRGAGARGVGARRPAAPACGAYSPAWLDQLCASGELVWVGAGIARAQLRQGRSAVPRGRAAGSDRPRSRPSAPPSRCTTRSASGWSAGASFWADLLADVADAEPIELQEALWDLVWAGEVTNDAFAPLRAPRLSLAREQRDAGRPVRPPAAAGRAPGAGPLVAHGARCSPTRPQHGPRMRALSEVLLERYGIVTRETVLAEGIPGGFASPLRRAGQPGDAGHGPPRLLRRGPGRRPVRAAGGDRAAARPARRRAGGAAGAGGHRSRQPVRRDPAVAAARGRAGGRRPSRVPGAYVVTLDAEPVLYVERGGKGLVPLREPRLRRSARAVAGGGARGAGRPRAPRPAQAPGLERFDGEPVVGSALEGLLVDIGFRQGPRRLTLSA